MSRQPVTVWLVRAPGVYYCLGCDRPVDARSVHGCRCVEHLYARVELLDSTPAWWRARYGRRKAPLWRD